MALIEFTDDALHAAQGRWPARSPDQRARPRSIRVFSGNVLDALSYAHPVLPALLWGGPLFWGLWVGVTGKPGVAGTVALFLGGWLAWTFVEYLLHRYVFHWQGDTERSRMFHFLAHGYHHEFPDDKLRLVAPPLMSGPIAVIMGTLYWFTLGSQLWLVALSGTIFGYLCYDYIHYYTHHGRPKSGPGKWLRTYHMRHHFEESEDTRFGVSSPLWDFVFRTYAAPSARAVGRTPSQAR